MNEFKRSTQRRVYRRWIATYWFSTLACTMRRTWHAHLHLRKTLWWWLVRIMSGPWGWFYLKAWGCWKAESSQPPPSSKFVKFRVPTYHKSRTSLFFCHLMAAANKGATARQSLIHAEDQYNKRIDDDIAKLVDCFTDIVRVGEVWHPFVANCRITNLLLARIKTKTSFA